MTDGKGSVTAAAVFSAPALIIAYFFQPDIAAMEPGQRAFLVLATLFAYVGLAVVFVRFRNVDARIFLVAAIVWLFNHFTMPVIQEYDRAVAVNRVRCAAVQRRMLSMGEGRGDDAAVFQALGCRPQGEQSGHVPPSETMIELHEWLPWGGVPAWKGGLRR